MIPLGEYPHIPYWFTLRQAMVEMDKLGVAVPASKYRPRVVLVFDKEYRLIGMVRRQDILRGLGSESLVTKVLGYRNRILSSNSEAGQTESFSTKLLESMRANGEKPISDVMLPIKDPVDFDDNIVKVIYKMLDQNVILLAVLKEGEVVGVVEIVEGFHEIAELLTRE